MRPRLSALRDGDAGRLRAALLRRHLSRCADCQRELRALEEAVRALGALREAPPDESSAGDEAGWRALQQALAASGPASDAGPPAPARSWVGRPPVLVLGAAMACALVVVLLRLRPEGLIRQPVNEDEVITLAEEQFRQTELEYQQALDQLRRISARRRARWQPAEARGFERGLSALERRMEQRRTAARTRPADAEAQEQLYAAYREEISYLQESLRPPALSQWVRTVGLDTTGAFGQPGPGGRP